MMEAHLGAFSADSTDLLQAKGLRFTTLSGGASLTAVLGSAILSIAQPILDKDFSDAVTVGLLGVLAAGLIGYALSSAGDVIARAYVSAHVSSADPKAAKPVLQAVASEVIAAYKQAPGRSNGSPSPSRLIALGVLCRSR